MTMELSSRDGYCGLWPVGSPHRLGSLGVATAPTTAGGTPEKGLSLGAEVKRGAQSPRAEGSYLVPCLPHRGLYLGSGVGGWWEMQTHRPLQVGFQADLRQV